MAFVKKKGKKDTTRPRTLNFPPCEKQTVSENTVSLLRVTRQQEENLLSCTN